MLTKKHPNAQDSQVLVRLSTSSVLEKDINFIRLKKKFY